MKWRSVWMALLIFTVVMWVYSFGKDFQRRGMRTDCAWDRMCCDNYLEFGGPKKDCFNCSEDQKGESSSPARIEVMLHYLPCGCIHKQSSTNTLEVDISARNLRFERIGNVLMVNGKIFKENASLRSVNPFHFNPWYVLEVEIENQGLIKDCQNPESEKKILITGDYGGYSSWIKGFIILLISVIPLLLLRKKQGRQVNIKKYVFILLAIFTLFIFADFLLGSAIIVLLLFCYGIGSAIFFLYSLLSKLWKNK